MHFAPDLQVGSVILKAMIVPSFQEPGLLAATMATKIALGWEGEGSLAKEIDEHDDHVERRARNTSGSDDDTNGAWELMDFSITVQLVLPL